MHNQNKFAHYNQKSWRIDEIKKVPFDTWRLRLAQIVVVILCLILISRAFHLMFIGDEFLREKGASRYERITELEQRRGSILDRNGMPLAASVTAWNVWINPQLYAEKQFSKELLSKYANQLSKILKVKKDVIFSRMARDSKKFIYLKRGISAETRDEILNLNIPGVYFDETYGRRYPYGKDFSQLLGFISFEGHGQEGLEFLFNDKLSGKPGMRHSLIDAKGRSVQMLSPLVPAQDGQSITLTLDPDLQLKANSALQESLDQFKAVAGSVIVLDAKTGEILALSNLPSFNPEIRKALKKEELRNRAVIDIYEPGSTMKPFTVAMALDKGLTHPNEWFDLRPGHVVIGGKRIGDSHYNEELDTTGIIQKSSNIGTAQIALRLEPTEMHSYFKALGFGVRPGTGFPGESKGILRNPKNWKPVEQATMSYGHGISVSLLQLASAYTTFANGGIRKTPYFIKDEKPENSDTYVFSKKASDQMLEMMKEVVTDEGTARRARVEGYLVGGKTGTANKVENGRYVKKYISSFVGLAPLSDPQFVVAVMVDEPTTGDYYGGLIAAPVFQKVMELALRKRGVQPDDFLYSPDGELLGVNSEIVRKRHFKVLSELRKQKEQELVKRAKNAIKKSKWSDLKE